MTDIIYINNNITNIKNIINSNEFINYSCKKHNPKINIDEKNIKNISLIMLIKNIKYFPYEISSLFNISEFLLDIVQKNSDDRISFSLNNFYINNEILNNIFKNISYKFIIFINEDSNDKNKSILTIKHKYNIINNDNNLIINILKNYIDNIMKNILTNKLEKNLNFFNQHK